MTEGTDETLEIICGALGLHPETELIDVLAAIQSVRSEARNYPNLQLKIEGLARWKAEQLLVESEWDAQAVGRLLQVPLGGSIRAAIQPGIEALQERVRQLQKREVSCVWCGLQFESTLQYQAQHLYQHAKECEKHPVRNLETQVRLLREALDELLPYAERFLLNTNKDMVGNLYPAINLAKLDRARAALAATDPEAKK